MIGEFAVVVCICGHSSFCEKNRYEQVVLDMLEELVGDAPADLLLGGYGEFDSFARSCCRKYQLSHPEVRLIFVTPYITLEYSKTRLDYEAELYDSIIYPEIENVPFKFAITKRNKYMVDSADVIIAYISHSWGGAYKTYAYATKRKKKIYNLYEDLSS